MNVKSAPLAIAIAGAAFLAHLATIQNYGYFRDELYFIACAHHLAWGYVDQPPLVAVAAWLAAPFGYALIALRFLPALAAGGMVFFTCALTRQLGGNRFAEVAAGVTAFVLPANLFLGSTLTTTSFEPFTWTLTIYLLACIVKKQPFGYSQHWYWLAAVAVFAFYAKYSILLLILSLATALLFTRERKLLLDRRLYIAALIAALATLPNTIWQAFQGWPFLEVLHNDVVGRHAYNSGLIFQTSGIIHNAFLFTLEQFAFTNPFLVPIWITGLIVLLTHPRFASFRFIGISYIALYIFAVSLEAKSYYIAGIYPSLIAAGIAFIFPLRTLRFLAQLLTAILLIAAAMLAPLALPILSPQTLIAYEAHLGIKEARGNPPRLVHPLFAEEFGWNELAQHVAQVYKALPANERAHTAIFADNYGDAGALDFYGPRYGLPAALSGQNSYYLWSTARLRTQPSQPTTLIAVGATQAAELRASFREVRLVMTYLHPFRWSAEGPTPIFLCRFPVEPLGRIFSRFRWYGA